MTTNWQQPSYAPPVTSYATPGQYAMDGGIDPADLSLDKMKILVYADFGQGKTSFGATAPNCCILESERGQASLRRPANPLDPRSRIFLVDTFDDMRTYYQRLRSGDLAHFDSVMIDSVSDLQEKCLFETMAEAEAKDSKRVKGVPQRNDYQIVTNKMRRMASRFRDLDKNIIFLAQYRNDRNPETPIGQSSGTTSRPVRADLTPAVYKGVAGYVDILAYLSTAMLPNGQRGHFLQFGDVSGQLSVKTRYRLPDYLPNPTFMGLIAAIERANG